jgi:hypothetical protein
MGYTTDFTGKFELNKKLDLETYMFLRKLNDTRRMARKVDKKYGVEGEFYVDGNDKTDEMFFDNKKNSNIIDYNVPPKTQPSLWCQWTPTEDAKHIEWDEGEKFYSYIEWLEYIIEKVLKPKGYKLNGEVEYQGEDGSDFGMIVVKNNVVKNRTGKKVYV